MSRMLAVWQQRSFSLRPVWNAQLNYFILCSGVHSKRVDLSKAVVWVAVEDICFLKKHRLSWKTLKRFVSTTQVWRNVIVSVLLPKNSHKKNILSQTISLLGYWEQKVEHVLWDQTVNTDESSTDAFISSCRCRYSSLHLRQATAAPQEASVFKQTIFNKHKILCLKFKGQM